MKRRLFLLAVCLVAALGFCVNAFAAENKKFGVSVAFPEEYTVLTEDTLRENREFLEHIGHTTESFRKKMEEGGILFYAATQDNRRQLQLKTWTSDFSETAQDFTRLSEDALASARDTLLRQLDEPGQTIMNTAQITAGSLIYLRITAQVTGGDRDFCYIQYLTLANGRFYALVYYNDEPELSAAQQQEAESVFSTLSVQKKKSGGTFAGGTVAQSILIVAVIIVAGVVAGMITVSFVREIRSRRMEPEQIPDRIKMRRKK